MKVFLYNMNRSERTEIEVPPLCVLEVVLEGSIPGYGTNTEKKVTISSGTIMGEEGIELHASAGRIASQAQATNAWTIGVTE